MVTLKGLKRDLKLFYSPLHRWIDRFPPTACHTYYPETVQTSLVAGLHPPPAPWNADWSHTLVSVVLAVIHYVPGSSLNMQQFWLLFYGLVVEYHVRNHEKGKKREKKKKNTINAKYLYVYCNKRTKVTKNLNMRSSNFASVQTYT